MHEMPPDSKLASQFSTLIGRWKRLIPLVGDPVFPHRDALPGTVRDAFGSFVRSMRMQLTTAIEQDLKRIAAIKTTLKRWWTEHDLLTVALLRFGEDGYTELMKWAMEASGSSELALLLQHAFLKHFNLFETCTPSKPAAIHSQFRTDYGNYPDMVMDFTTLVVVIEAKTGTDEHETRTSKEGDTLKHAMQTEAYPWQVRETLGRSDSLPVPVVFVTPDRCKPQNERALRLSYLEFAIILAHTLSKVPEHCIHDSLRWAYKAVISHFTVCGLSQEAVTFIFVNDNSLPLDKLSLIQEISDRLGEVPYGED
ncbi:MAG: hypothetical protein IT461_05020 [Planctomycetes bacterium]|nr:hypothetical protein [Planctomycetota bacterium]